MFAKRNINNGAALEAVMFPKEAKYDSSLAVGVLFKHIAKTAYRSDLYARRLELCAQARDVHLDRIRGEVFLPVGKRLDKRILAHHLLDFFQKDLQHRPFTRREFQRCAFEKRTPAGAVELERPVDGARTGAGLPSADQRTDPRGQLRKRKRLGHVVVCAEIQAM